MCNCTSGDLELIISGFRVRPRKERARPGMTVPKQKKPGLSTGLLIV
jgi:hypothetical protein